MSVWTAAKTTPNSALNRPIPSTSAPHHHSPVWSRSKVTRSTPYTAVFSISPLIIAETGEGAAGCASGSQTWSGTSPALAPKPSRARRKATVAHAGRERRPSHRIEGELPAATLQDPEAEEDAERADVGDEQVEEARPANLGNAVLGGDQEVRAEGHRLPRHHEEVGVVGHHHQDHAGEEDVVLQAEEAGRGSFAGAEVARGEDRDPRSRRSQQEQEEPGERVEPQVEGEVRQPEREHHLLLPACPAGAPRHRPARLPGRSAPRGRRGPDRRNRRRAVG